MAYALVTGAGKGIGKAMALELAARGYDILLISRTEQDLILLCKQLEEDFAVKTGYRVADLSAQGAATEVFEWVQGMNIPLEVLVNNAGYGMSGYFAEQEMAQLENMMQLNMFAAKLFLHHAP